MAEEYVTWFNLVMFASDFDVQTSVLAGGGIPIIDCNVQFDNLLSYRLTAHSSC